MGGKRFGTDALRVRPAMVADVAGVVEIERDAFSVPWSWRSFVELVDMPDAVFLVATDDTDRVLGYSVLYIGPQQSELANIAVSAHSRRRGVGRRLLDAMLIAARDRGATVVFLEVRDSNRTAQDLYASAGFYEVGRRTRYYTHPLEDARVLRLDIRPVMPAPASPLRPSSRGA
jgi:ribosomal-protein-alanine N-acetyltransferase